MNAASDIPRRSALRLAVIAIVGLTTAVVLLGGLARLAPLTPWGRQAVMTLAEGRGGAGVTIASMRGLSGDVWSRFRIEEIVLADQQGEFATIKGVELAWSPLGLINRRIDMDTLAIDQVRLTRQPQLTERDGPSQPSQPWRFDVASAQVTEIELAPEVLNVAARLSVSASVHWTADEQNLELNLQRLDGPEEGLSLTFARNGDRARGDLYLAAPAGGPLATALRAPNHAIDVNANLNITGASGALNAVGRVDGHDAMIAAITINDGEVQGEGSVTPTHLPWLAAIADRFDSAIVFDVRARPRAGARRVRLSVHSEGVGSLRLRGDVPMELTLNEILTVDPFELTAQLPDPTALFDLPSGVALGAVELTGDLLVQPRLGVNAEIIIHGAGASDVRVAQIDGPITVSLDNDQSRLRVQSNLRARELETRAEWTPMLGVRPRIALDASLNTRTNALNVDEFTIGVVGGRLTISGDLNANGELNADALVRVPNLSRAHPDMEGSAEILARVSGTAWGLAGPNVMFTLGGQARDLIGPNPDVAALLGDSIDIDVSGAFQPDRLMITDARLQTRGVTMRGEGVLAEDRAEDEQPLQIALVSNAPIMWGGAVRVDALTGDVTATGSPSRATLALEISATQIAVQGASFIEPRASADLTIEGLSATGPVELSADLDGQALAFSGALNATSGRIAMQRLTATGFDARVTGDVAIDPTSGLLTADVDLAYADIVTGSVTVAALQGVQSYTAELAARDLPLTPDMRVHEALLSIQGDLNQAAFTLQSETYLPSANATIQAAGDVALIDDAVAITLSPSLAIGPTTLDANAPIEIAVALDGRFASFTGALSGEDGAQLTLAGERKDGQTDLTLTTRNAPIAILAAFADLPALEGTWNADLSLAGADTLAGPMDVNVRNVKPAGDSGPGVDAMITAQFDESGVSGVVNIQSNSDLNANGDFEAPLTLAAWRPQAALAANAPMRAAIQAQGQLTPLTSLALTTDQAVSGAVSLNAAIAGTPSAPIIEGDAELTDGRFEDAAAGLALTNIRGRAQFTQDRAILENLELDGVYGGRATAEGRFDFATMAADVAVAMDELTALRLPVAEVTTSGNVRLTRSSDGMALSGALRIDSAEVQPLEADGRARPPSLNVVEVNRPDDLPEPPTPTPPVSIDLDVEVSAERRVFFRGYGLDTEWAGAFEIKGPSAAPNMFGRANLVRGDLQFAGQRFTFDNAAITTDGDPLDATIDLTARRDQGDITAFVTIVGPIANPNITVSSTPALPEDEVLARLLFGRSAGQLSGLQAAQLAAAINNLSQGGDPGMLNNVREAVGLDRLSLREGEDGETQVAGGVYLSDDVYVELATDATGAGEAEVHWRLSRFLELVSRFNGARGAAVDLRWRRDY